MPDIDEAFLAADGPGADDHALEHGVRIALDDAAIHEGARVAFIRVADDDRLHAAVHGGLSARLPLDSRREPAAAAPPQPGALDLAYDLLRRHLLQSFDQRGVAVDGDVVVDPLGIDRAAIAEHDQLLLGEERDVLQRRDRGLFLRRRIHELLDRPPLEEVLLHQ